MNILFLMLTFYRTTLHVFKKARLAIKT